MDRPLIDLKTMKAPMLLYILIVLLHHTVCAQARKPIIMVVPGDNWCFSHNYITEFVDSGSVTIIPDYKRALRENTELTLVISKINEMMSDRGFPLKLLESTIRTLDQQRIDDAMLTAQSGSEILETPIDRLRNIANADIWMQINWKINQSGPRRSISFSFQGIDAYTNKQIAGASGTGAPSLNVETPLLLEEAVLAHIDNFNYQLQRHFDDLFENGREVVVRILTFKSFNGNLESRFYGQELHEIIDDWVRENTVNSRYSITLATENRMLFEQVRIPLFDQRNRAIDSRTWARGLQRHLSEKYNIDSKLMTRGLGQAQLVIGER